MFVQQLHPVLFFPKRGKTRSTTGKVDVKLIDPNSMLAKEIKYLVENGYEFSSDFSKLVKK
jgi:hypothetical protein